MIINTEDCNLNLNIKSSIFDQSFSYAKEGGAILIETNAFIFTPVTINIIDSIFSNIFGTTLNNVIQVEYVDIFITNCLFYFSALEENKELTDLVTAQQIFPSSFLYADFSNIIISKSNFTNLTITDDINEESILFILSKCNITVDAIIVENGIFG